MYLKTTYQQIQVSILLKACMDKVTENGTESHISQRRELYLKEGTICMDGAKGRYCKWEK